MANFGEGNLGKIIAPNFEYQLTWDDLLWTGRMLMGESGTEIGRKAVLWTQAQRLVYFRGRSFKNLIQGHSQPINPKWRRDGEFCRPGGRNAGTDACSPSRLDRRDRIANTPWEQIPLPIQDLVVKWARGEVDNVVPKAVDFAVPKVGNRSRPGGAQARGFFLVWDDQGRPIESLEEGGNAFYGLVDRPQKAGTQNWLSNHVKIQFGSIQSGESAPEQGNLSSTNNSSGNNVNSAAPPNDVVERINALTQGRTSPPVATKYQYFVLGSGAVENIDPQCSFAPLNPSVGGLANHIQAPYQKFYEQVNALKEATNLEMTKAVPVFQIFAYDENNNLVNLNEIIFARPTFHNIFEPVAGYEALPERPIASLNNLTLTIQSPSVGGATSISVGTLSLKIHNPYLIDDNHPQGKYISFMMRPGYYLRIRYGVENLDNIDAFQTIEEDFFTTQPSYSTADDLQLDMKINIMPAFSKLFNQVLIGESLPATEITQQDVVQSLDAVLTEDTSPQQRANIKNNLSRLSRSFNSRLQSVGIRTEIADDNTFRSVLHGTLTNDQLLSQEGSGLNVPVSNMIEALQTIQSILLTRRYEQIIAKSAYLYTNKEIPVPAVNIGPLLFELVRPEIMYISNIASTNALGANNTNIRNQNRNRKNVKLVFGKFNQRAGQWANKSISVMPIPLDALFSYFREKRELGRFSDSVNNFMGNINSILQEPANYIVEQNPNQRIELPDIRFRFYPDPTTENDWIFYIYDNKERLVQFSLLLEATSDNTLTKDKIKQLCADFLIPWIELGTENSFIKSLQATTQGDDQIMSHNMYQANQLGFSQRAVDVLPPGISREFLAGTQVNNNQAIIRSTTIILPLKFSLTCASLTSAIYLAGIYVFAPINQTSGLFNIYSLVHEVQKDGAKTNMELQINLSGRNRAPVRNV